MSGQHTQEWIDAACSACEGLTQDHFDGGWTAKNLSKYAKGLEVELDAARALLHEVLNHGVRVELCNNNDRMLEDRIRSYLDACDTLGGKG